MIKNVEFILFRSRELVPDKDYILCVFRSFLVIDFSSFYFSGSMYREDSKVYLWG